MALDDKLGTVTVLGVGGRVTDNSGLPPG